MRRWRVIRLLASFARISSDPEEERLLGLGFDANAKTATLAGFMGRFFDFMNP